MLKAAKKKAPSKIKYDQGHPTVSCRVSKELYDRLKAVTKAEGRSFADVLKVGLGLLEVRAKQEAGGRKKSYDEGYKIGHEGARRLYRVVFRCAGCRNPIEVTSPQAKQAAQQYLEQHGWGHAECPKK